MFSCAVEGCKNSVEFIFPSNMDRRQKWLEAIRRPTYVPKKRHGICSLHFTIDDFIHESRDGGFKNSRRILQKDAVPCVFMWTLPESLQCRQTDYEKKPVIPEQLSRIKYEIPIQEEDRNKDTVRDNVDFGTMTNIPVNDRCGKFTNEVTVKHEPLWEYNYKEQEKFTNSTSVQTQSPFAIMTIEHFRDRPDAVLYYTGLESYTKFMSVLRFLKQKIYRSQYRDRQMMDIGIADQLFITLWKLRRNCTDFELSINFNASEATISNIIRAWIKFMARRWSEVNIRPSKKLVRCYISPPSDRSPFTIINNEIIEIKTDELLNSRKKQSTFSIQKNRNMLETLVSITSGSAYGRLTSRPQIIKHSLLSDTCDLDDPFGMDREFSLQSIITAKNSRTEISTFLEQQCVSPAKIVLNNRKLDKDRVCVARVIRLAKNYKILHTQLDCHYVSLTSEIYTAIVMLCKFEKGIRWKVG